MKRRSVQTGQFARKKKMYLFAVIGMMYRIGSGLFKVFLLLTLITVISLSFLSVYNYLMRSPYMRLENVDVTGIDGNIRYEMIRMSGLNTDVSLLSLNLNKLKYKMEQHPWIRSVKLERRFPHTLVVQAEKEAPLAIVVMGKNYFMNQWGEVFKQANDLENLDLPIITGISEDVSKRQVQLEKAVYVINTLKMEDEPWSLNELSEIHLKKHEGISLYFNNLAAEIKIVPSDLKNKIDGLRKVAEHLIETGRVHQVKNIDLNYKDGAVVSFRKG